MKQTFIGFLHIFCASYVIFITPPHFGFTFFIDKWVFLSLQFVTLRIILRLKSLMLFISRKMATKIQNHLDYLKIRVKRGFTQFAILWSNKTISVYWQNLPLCECTPIFS